MSDDLQQRIKSLERENKKLGFYLLIFVIATTGLMLTSIYLSTQLSLTRIGLEASQGLLKSQEMASRARLMEVQAAMERAEKARQETGRPKSSP